MKKTYALVGTGGRAEFFYGAIAKDFRDTCDLMNDLFGYPSHDEFNRAASHIDGAMSILTGVAENKSLRTGNAEKIDRLIKF